MKQYRFTHNPVRIILSALCALLILGQPAYAGKLNDFETEATDDDPRYRPAQNDDDDDDGLFGAILHGIFRVLFEDDDDKRTYAEDHARVRPRTTRNSSATYYPPLYNPMLRPYFRVDSAYQNVESDVHAWDFRAEGGLQWFAGQFRLTCYREEEPDDTLWLNSVHILPRLPLGDQMSIAPGPGVIFLVGNNENAGFSFTLPVLVYPHKAVGFEFRPTWSWIDENTIHDYDVSLALGGKTLAFRTGYRWMYTDDESLNGVYFGLTSRF